MDAAKLLINKNNDLSSFQENKNDQKEIKDGNYVFDKKQEKTSTNKFGLNAEKELKLNETFFLYANDINNHKKLEKKLSKTIESLTKEGANHNDIIRLIGKLLDGNEPHSEEHSSTYKLLRENPNNKSIIKVILELNWDDQDKINFLKAYIERWNYHSLNIVAMMLYRKSDNGLTDIVESLKYCNLSDKDIAKYLKAIFLNSYDNNKSFIESGTLGGKKEIADNTFKIIHKTLKNLNLSSFEIEEIMYNMINKQHDMISFTSNFTGIGKETEDYNNVINAINSISDIKLTKFKKYIIYKQKDERKNEKRNLYLQIKKEESNLDLQLKNKKIMPKSKERIYSILYHLPDFTHEQIIDAFKELLTTKTTENDPCSYCLNATKEKDPEGTFLIEIIQYLKELHTWEPKDRLKLFYTLASFKIESVDNMFTSSILADSTQLLSFLLELIKETNSPYPPNELKRTTSKDKSDEPKGINSHQELYKLNEVFAELKVDVKSKIKNFILENLILKNFNKKFLNDYCKEITSIIEKINATDHENYKEYKYLKKLTKYKDYKPKEFFKLAKSGDFSTIEKQLTEIINNSICDEIDPYDIFIVINNILYTKIPPSDINSTCIDEIQKKSPFNTIVLNIINALECDGQTKLNYFKQFGEINNFAHAFITNGFNSENNKDHLEIMIKNLQAWELNKEEIIDYLQEILSPTFNQNNKIQLPYADISKLKQALQIIINVLKDLESSDNEITLIMSTIFKDNYDNDKRKQLEIAFKEIKINNDTIQENINKYNYHETPNNNNNNNNNQIPSIMDDENLLAACNENLKHDMKEIQKKEREKFYQKKPEEDNQKNN